MGADTDDSNGDVNFGRNGSKYFANADDLSASLSSSLESQEEPATLDKVLKDSTNRRYSRRLSSGSQTLPYHALGALRRTLTGATSDLSRYNTCRSVKDIYGPLDEEQIAMRRTATRGTILSALSQRVNDVEREAQDEKAPSERIYENEIPDIPVPTKDYGAEFSQIDPELVTWEGTDDPEDPRNWPLWDKVFQTGIVSIYTLISPMSSSVCSPAMDFIAKDFGIQTTVLKAFSVSIMVLAWALGPIIIAPLSESDRIGRRSVLNTSIWIAFIFNLACAFCKNTALLCVFRFLGGLGGCASLNVGAGTIADLWSNRERQFAMAAYSISPTLGPVISPVISGFIVENKRWKWVFIVLAIFNGFVAAFGTVFFKETYSPKLLREKAKLLRKETGNENLHTIFEISNGETLYEKITMTVTRPLRLIITNPMVFGLGSFMAFIYGFMYLMIVTFPAVFMGSYGFSIGITGLMYIPMGIGYILGIIVFTYLMSYFYDKLTLRNGGVSKPEYRLPCLCAAGIGIPVGLFWYGWSVEKKLHWIMPSIGSGIFAFSMIAVFQTIQNYLIDMNNRLSASFIASCSIFRSLFGFGLPLVAAPMYDKLGYGWGNTLCGFIALGLGLPFPVFCLMYGEKLRDWANKKEDLRQAARDARHLKRLQEKNDKEMRLLLEID